MLNEREQQVLKQMCSARIAEITRKRPRRLSELTSWRLSELTTAIVEVIQVTEKVLKG